MITNATASATPGHIRTFTSQARSAIETAGPLTTMPIEPSSAGKKIVSKSGPKKNAKSGWPSNAARNISASRTSIWPKSRSVNLILFSPNRNVTKKSHFNP